MKHGISGNIGIAQEGEFGKKATDNYSFTQTLGEGMKMENNLRTPDVVRGCRFPTIVDSGRVSAGGIINLNVFPEGAFPWLLKGLFGQVTSQQVAEGVYDHSFEPINGVDLPGFTVLTDHDVSRLAWIGSCIDGMIIKMNGDYMAAEAHVLSQRPEEDSDVPVPVFYRVDAWSGYNMEFELNGSDRLNVKNFRIELDNDIESVWTLNRSRYCNCHVPRVFTVKGSMTLLFDSDSERRQLWGSAGAIGPERTLTPGALTISAIHDQQIDDTYKYNMSIDIPCIYYQAAPAHYNGAKQAITQRVTFQAIYKPEEGRYMEMTLRNSVSGYPNP